MNKEAPRHPSMRGEFAYQLHQQMQQNSGIWVVTGDLGYGMLDAIRSDFPDRFINTGAAEQAMMGIGVGLALEGKIPFVYSISTFLLLRPFETIRNYLHREKIPVRLVGGGRDRDYAHDGYSHHPLEDRALMGILKNIYAVWPETATEIPDLVSSMVEINSPWYVNLRR